MKRQESDSLVSIVLCTFNRRDLVDRAIRSVMHQSYRHWQLIIVDDGSTDGSERLLLPIARHDSRILYVGQSNHGLAYARNVGLRCASGEYVGFLDSDDEYAPDHIARRVEFMNAHPLVDAVHGGVRIIGPRRKHYVPDVDRPGKKIRLSECNIGGTLFAKRRCLLAVGGFTDVTFSEDYALMRKLRRTYRLRKVDYRTYIYHVDTDSRLCDLYEEGGDEEILLYRAGER